MKNSILAVCLLGMIGCGNAPFVYADSIVGNVNDSGTDTNEDTNTNIDSNVLNNSNDTNTNDAAIESNPDTNASCTVDAASVCGAANTLCGLSIEQCGQMITCGCTDPAFTCGVPDLKTGIAIPTQCGLDCEAIPTYASYCPGRRAFDCKDTAAFKSYMNTTDYMYRYNCILTTLVANGDLLMCCAG